MLLAYETGVVAALPAINLVPLDGNDPSTLALSRRCSTTELQRYSMVLLFKQGRVTIVLELLPYVNTLGADQALTGIEPATPESRAVTNEPMRLV